MLLACTLLYTKVGQVSSGDEVKLMMKHASEWIRTLILYIK